MSTPEKPPAPADPRRQEKRPPEDAEKKPVDVDIDDALIEEPRDDVFRKAPEPAEAPGGPRKKG
jgi:hypothetical protein